MPPGGSWVPHRLHCWGPSARSPSCFISFSKLSREGRIILEHGKEAGYQTMTFVSRTIIPARERTDISLFVYRGEEKEYHSLSAPAAMVDALVVAVSDRLGQRGTESLETLHQMKKKYFPEKG